MPAFPPQHVVDCDKPRVDLSSDSRIESPPLDRHFTMGTLSGRIFFWVKGLQTFAARCKKPLV